VLDRWLAPGLRETGKARSADGDGKSKNRTNWHVLLPSCKARRIRRPARQSREPDSGKRPAGSCRRVVVNRRYPPGQRTDRAGPHLNSEFRTSDFGGNYQRRRRSKVAEAARNPYHSWTSGKIAQRSFQRIPGAGKRGKPSSKEPDLPLTGGRWRGQQSGMCLQMIFSSSAIDRALRGYSRYQSSRYGQQLRRPGLRRRIDAAHFGRHR